MCEFCEKHGHGNRWFLNPDNFSDEMMEDEDHQKLIEEVCGQENKRNARGYFK
jgi:hypothetical protein